MADSPISALAALTAAGVATDDQFVIVDTSATETKRIAASELTTFFGGGGGGSGLPAAIDDWAAIQNLYTEPLALEAGPRIGTGTWTVGSSATKYVLNAWNVKLTSAAVRYDHRDPRSFVPFRGVTLTGLSADAMVVSVDPAAVTYTSAYETYLERMVALDALQTHSVQISAASTITPFIPGPYGSIVRAVHYHDTTWMIMLPVGSNAGGWNLGDEIGDSAGDGNRLGFGLILPVSKLVASGVKTGIADGADSVAANVVYSHLPSTWSPITDPNTYSFRDDFMGASLDTGSTWSRTQSTAGNVEIVPKYAACSITGNGSWGTNGLFSQTSVSRASGVTFEVDAYIGTATPNLIVGFHDGAGVAFSDMVHGVDFANTGSANRIKIYEEGNDRGYVGPAVGWRANTLYRVRITLNGSGAATYEMQGGTEYPAIGSGSWTDITPGTSSTSTSSLRAGAVMSSSGTTCYLSDMKIYT